MSLCPQDMPSEKTEVPNKQCVHRLKALAAILAAGIIHCVSCRHYKLQALACIRRALPDCSVIRGVATHTYNACNVTMHVMFTIFIIFIMLCDILM